MALAGVASSPGTERFRQRFASLHPTHFRPLQDLWASSIGLGTYLGDSNDETDALYAEALRSALANGCNVIDTAVNYRCQRSERVIGRTLAALVASGTISREEILICTKGGYVPFDTDVPADPNRYVAETIINAGLATYDELVAACHCLAPTFLEASLKTSLANLRLQTIDVYYLHNPEQQLEAVDRETFLKRMEGAMKFLEQSAQQGLIRYYGVATWNGFRQAPTARDYLSLESFVQLAAQSGGQEHHFRVIQLPYNLAMPEAFSFNNQVVAGQSMPLLEAAAQLDVSVVSSASLLQRKLAQLPTTLADRIPGLSSSAQRAIQFVRSTPGLTTALVGMKQRAHVEENLELAKYPLLSVDAVRHLFDRPKRAYV